MAEAIARLGAPRRTLYCLAGVAAVVGYLVLAASPAGAAGVAANPDTGPPGTSYTVTATDFGLKATGAPSCGGTLNITFRTTGGTVIQTLYSGAAPTSNSQVYGPFGAPNVAATTYEIFASCPAYETNGIILSATNYFVLTAPPPTTTTTTTTTTVPPTTAPPTTTPTTHPVTTTTAGHGTTATTKPSSSTTSSTSSTTTTTKPGTTTTTTTATPVVLSGEDLELSSLSIPPAGSVSATGQGCKASVPVLLTVDQAIVGATKSGANGSFSTPLNVSTFPVGQYLVVAHCGPTLTSDLDVVLATEANPDTSTLLIIVFFLLIGLALFRRRIHLDAPAAAGQVDEEEENGTPL